MLIYRLIQMKKKSIIIAILSAGLILCAFTPRLIFNKTYAQAYINRKQFLDIDELTKLIKKAKEVGMSDEDLRNITIPYDETEISDFIKTAKEAGISDTDLKRIIPEGKREIVVIEYINLIERLTKLKEEKLKEFLSKKFLTVNDVFKELVVNEPETIQKLREELVSER